MIIYNAILTSKKWEKTQEGYMRNRVRVLANRIMQYSTEELGLKIKDKKVINVFVPQETLNDSVSLRSLEGAQIVAGEHQWINMDNIKEYSKGNVAGSPSYDGEYIECDVLVTDPATIENIQNGKLQEVSSAYTSDIVFNAGIFNGQEYDAIQKNIKYNHLAIIPSGTGRAGKDVRIINTAMKKKEAKMPVRIRLQNTKRVVEIEEESVPLIEEEVKVLNSKIDEANLQIENAKKETEEVKIENKKLGEDLKSINVELQNIKDKMPEEIENRASEMVEEKENAEKIAENCSDGVKKKIMNSIKGKTGTELKKEVLTCLGVPMDNMSEAEIAGAFKAQLYFANTKTKVAGTAFTQVPNMTDAVIEKPQRSLRSQLGFPE